MTEIESRTSGSLIARGMSENCAQSRKQAFQSASQRLLRARRFDLTVGG
jgi:hypothetical protein